MTTENGNPTSSDGGATTADPIDRIEAYLAATDGGDSNPTTENEGGDKDATPDKPEGDARDESDEPQLTTAQLAKYLGVDESAIDVDDDGAPVFKTKINGKEGAAKFNDLVKSYQLQGHAENRVREVAQREQMLQARMQQADQAIHARLQQFDNNLQQVATLTQVAQDEMAREYRSIDWNNLRQTNPGEYAALQTEFQNRNARLQGVFGELNQRRAQAMQVAQYQQQQAHQQHAYQQVRALEGERQRLTEFIPEWTNAEVAAKEKAAIRDWAIKSGFPPEEVDNLSRAHHVKAMRDAWRHDSLQKKRPDIENKVRTAPKLVKPGNAPSTDGKAATLKSLRHAVRNSSGGNSTKNLADYLLASGKA